MNTALIRTEYIPPPHGSHQAFSTTLLLQQWKEKTCHIYETMAGTQALFYHL